MTEQLLNWLNNEIVLSKPVKNISTDFRNGYLFAELLYKTKQIPRLSLFINSNNHKDIILNFMHLQKNFLDIGIILDENSRNEIINGGPYTAKIYLFKIRQILAKKNIDLNQLKIRESNALQKLYNKICFKNENEKYLHDLKIKIGNQDNRTLQKNNSMAYLPILGKSFENVLNNKYAVNGSVFNEFKKKYAHLNFGEGEIKMIMEDMKDRENKLLYLKDNVTTTEQKRKIFFKEQNEEINKKWKSSMINMEKFKIKKIKESWDPVIKYKNHCFNSFKRSANIMEKVSNDFENKIKYLVDENGKNKNREEISSEIIMLRMRQKLDEKIKNKKDKEKRERKRLREEQEMNYRIFAKKSMDDMVNLMENNLRKEKSEIIKSSEGLNKIMETKEKEKSEDKKIEKIKEEKNVDEKVQTAKSRNINKKEEEKTETTDFRVKEKEKTKSEEVEKIQEKMGQTATSSYSKLTANDFGAGLIKECYSIHNFNIGVNDRIKLFKTLILPINKEEIEKQYQMLPKIELNSTSTNQSLIKNYSCSNIFGKNISFNNQSIFDKKLYLEEINKLDRETFSKEFEKKLKKFEKNQKLMEPILNEILELTDYIENYQERKGVYLLDNSKWDELMIKFKNYEPFFDEEEKIAEKKEDESIYLFDYGEKISQEENKKIFDYINYMDMFNDLIIPNEIRGKKYQYQELYKDFYSKQNNQGLDIKEYEPNEEESENLFLPKNPNIKNFKFSDIIENMIENKYNISQNKTVKEGPNNTTNIYEQKGKFFFLPIKMVINGYPMSGKKTQSQLINEKYKGIKIYDPQKLLENKMKEYQEIKELKEQPDKGAPAKGKHKNKKEDKKEIEEKIKEFEPVLEIISPYVEYMDKINKTKEKEKEKEKESKNKKTKGDKKDGDKKKGKKKKKNKGNEKEEKKMETTEGNKTQENMTQEDNTSSSYNTKENYYEKEEMLNDIYMKLIIYQLEKDFPNNIESRLKFVEDLKGKYEEYRKLKEKIKELNSKKEEEELKEKEITETKPKNKNKKNPILSNINKELDNTTKLYNSVTNSLYVGFILINFPKNLKEAEKLEKYFTGYESEFEKAPEEYEKKLYSYESIIDLNVKIKKKGIGQFSLFDLFINFSINSNEVDRRYNGAKYDPLSGTIYHIDDNPPGKEDKKKENRLVSGIPNLTKEEFYIEKSNYEKNIRNLERLYKAMTNGFDKVYKSIDQMDIKYIHSLNISLENNINEIIFNNYYHNIEDIFNYVNNNKAVETKEKMKEDLSASSIQQVPIKEEILNSSIDIFKAMNNMNNQNLYEELIFDFDSFCNNYRALIKNFIHFIFRQKEHIINYLTKIQNDFIAFLNRKTEKTEIAEIYIQKYNSLLEEHPEVKNIPAVYNELSENIKDVIKSIWVKIQSKKNTDVKFLQDLKSLGKKEKEINKFWEYIILIFESEIKKYLTICEIIIKYYLKKHGLFNHNNNHNDNQDNNNNEINKENKYLYKIDHKKYLFQEIELPNNIVNRINKNNDLDFDKSNLKDEYKEKENENEINNSILENKENDKFINKDLKKYYEEKIDVLFNNSLKIIIREDQIIKSYSEKIKDKVKDSRYAYERNLKQSTKIVNNYNILSIEGNSIKAFSSSVSARSFPKRKITKKSKLSEMMGEHSAYEEIKFQIIKEKRKLKYRLMFLKYYSIRYINIINECFNETYNAMDDLIIMSVRSQNNILNEFMSYLYKSLNNFYTGISLDNFEFDSFDIYRRYKIDLNVLYEKMKFNYIFNVDKYEIGEKKDEENKKAKNKIIICEDEMSYTQLFAYNLNDLMNIYNYMRLYGANTCNFFVKYDYVKEILIHQYFTKKKYGSYDNKNMEENNNSIIFQILSEENNGICKKIFFLSNAYYINFLNKFSIYNNNYININELFTSLLLLGSQNITSEKFIELIKEYLPENKKDSKYILLTKEEFMKIPFWFEKDEYLNVLVDYREKEFYFDISKNYYSEENIREIDNENADKPIKINCVKEAIFEINSEDNLIDINKIIVLLNKINGVEDIKIVDGSKKEKESNIIKNTDDDTNKKVEIEGGNSSSFNEEINKIDMTISKGKETDSKATFTIQSDLEMKRKKKQFNNNENINNIFNALFIH